MSLYDTYIEVSDSVFGWLTKPEQDALLIASVLAYEPYAHYVEFGAFQGKSTVIIGGVLKVHGNGRLYSVDPHEGVLSYPSYVKNGGLTGEMRNSQEPTRKAWDANIKRAGLKEFVECVPDKSTNFYPAFKADFLFIDALHDEESVAADWNHAKSYVIKVGAIVAWHDYGAWQGVTDTVDRLIKDGTIEKELQMDSMIVTRYKGSE